MSSRITVGSSLEARQALADEGAAVVGGRSLEQERALSLDLQQAVEAYMSRSSVRSVAFVARKSGLPYSTVRRVVQGEGTPTFSTVIAILSVIMDCDGLLEFIQKYFPECYEILSLTFAHGDRPVVYDAKLKQYLHDPLCHHILHLCSCNTGTTVSKVEQMFGELGVRKLQAMIDDGYITLDGQELRVGSQGLHPQSPESLLNHIDVLTQIFDARNLGTEAALLAIVSESVSLKGLAQIKEAGLNYSKKVDHVRTTHGGSIPFFIGLIQTMVDSKVYEQERARLKGA